MVKTIANRIYLDSENKIYSIKLAKSIHSYRKLLDSLKDYLDSFYIYINEDNDYFYIHLKPKVEMTDDQIEELLWLLSLSSFI